MCLEEIWKRKSSDLTACQREQLWQLLEEFKDSFTLNDSEGGLVHTWYTMRSSQVPATGLSESM